MQISTTCRRTRARIALQLVEPFKGRIESNSIGHPLKLDSEEFDPKVLWLAVCSETGVEVVDLALFLIALRSLNPKNKIALIVAANSYQGGIDKFQQINRLSRPQGRV